MVGSSVSTRKVGEFKKAKGSRKGCDGSSQENKHVRSKLVHSVLACRLQHGISAVTTTSSVESMVVIAV